ncbi:MAG: N-acetylmuramoyl-L-alanine amidase [Clostridia bacterium]|nr:N-acetylmuramoyl-L-alanine amidase [Clostridia bacterium]
MNKRLKALFLFIGLILLFVSCSGEMNEEEKKPPKDPGGTDGKVTVLLDAGHGFGDVGCTSEYLDGLYEHELTMDFTVRLADKLRALGYAVILTHDGISCPTAAEICEEADKLGIEYDAEKMSPGNNVFDAYERAIYANVLAARSEIDFMLSIHVNANADTNTATGFEIDYCAENSSSEMSEFVFDSICNAIQRDYPERRLKQFADSWDMAFIVTKYTSMPSILFETGFASTPSDAELLLDEAWRDNLMTTIAEGIEDYFLK